MKALVGSCGMHPNAALYLQDCAAWCSATAALIRDRKWPDINLEALAEELDSLGRSQKHALKSRFKIFLIHLLTWCYQPARREHRHSWYDTILEQRSQLKRLLRDNPGLRPQVPGLLPEVFPDALRRASGETRLLARTFPAHCPWRTAQLLDANFWPLA